MNELGVTSTGQLHFLCCTANDNKVIVRKCKRKKIIRFLCLCCSISQVILLQGLTEHSYLFHCTCCECLFRSMNQVSLRTELISHSSHLLNEIKK